MLDKNPTEANWRKFLTFFRLISECLVILEYEVRIKFFYQIKGRRKNKASEASPQIHLFYITCKKDYEYLVISLESLQKLRYKPIGNVYIYVDKKDPLTEEQIASLKREFPQQIFVNKTHYKLAWGGAKLIVSELLAFRKINSEIDDKHFVFKIDSDVLFISDKIFRDLMENDFDVLGQQNNRGFMQGGSYFIRNSVIAKMIRRPIYGAIHEVCQRDWPCPLFECPEDRTISKIIKQCGYELNVLHFCPRPDMESDQEFSILHFSPHTGSRKELMKDIWQEYKKKYDELGQ